MTDVVGIQHIQEKYGITYEVAAKAILDEIRVQETKDAKKK